MKQWALAWVAWALAGAALAVEATPPARHTVEAQVNGRVITTRDVYRQVESRWKELIRGKDQAEKAGRPYDLEQLMNEAWIEAGANWWKNRCSPRRASASPRITAR